MSRQNVLFLKTERVNYVTTDSLFHFFTDMRYEQSVYGRRLVNICALIQFFLQRRFTVTAPLSRTEPPPRRSPLGPQSRIVCCQLKIAFHVNNALQDRLLAFEKHLPLSVHCTDSFDCRRFVESFDSFPPTWIPSAEREGFVDVRTVHVTSMVCDRRFR
ncbi:hypothetical protein CEXT_77741 [Caerostris extrusa]|uniref:Uncharacterized protein n=1 Tax=Caerostris extrusa TaxID=172846 RepID=A0AAV4U5R2_CAEEX|nr:hypothetical protein CEXT_77741 [Caerostris extrusa]